jgi:WD40 repeat protein
MVKKRKYLHMQKGRDQLVNSRTAKRRRRRTIAGFLLAGLVAYAALVSHLLLIQYEPGNHATVRAFPSQATVPYLYYVLKKTGGFVLARAREGENHQPLETPQVVAKFSDGFGQSTADSVISLQLSPDRRYLAIDGTRSDGELLWIFDTRRLLLRLEPANVSGTFLHWMPGASEMFLYRPMFPRGPGALLNGGTWNPGLWEVNAATGAFTNIDIHMPSAFLVDAVASPDGSQILYSTSSGLGMGSEIWTMGVHGEHQVRLLHLSGSAQSIAGLFAWSPNGQSIAYERLSDGPTPFLPAGLWIMNRRGGEQRFLAKADGGHGFGLTWSPDGKEIAYVARTNPGVSQADQQTQALESAIGIVDVDNGRAHIAAGPAQTGVQINTNPVWSADGSHITFAAYNPLNPDLGGTSRYWSVSASPTAVNPGVVPLSQPVTQVIALS